MSGLVVLLCGYSFSGKSTLAAALHQRCGAAVVCPDAINARRFPSGADLADRVIAALGLA